VGDTKEAPIGGFPYQVALYNNYNFMCSGVLYKRNYVITAASCFYSRTPNTALVGSNNVYDGSVYSIERCTRHPEHYYYRYFKNDIAVCKLARRFTPGPTVRAIEIDMDFKENAPAIVSGWGRNTNPGGLSPKLRYANVRILSEDTCKYKVRSNSSLFVDDTIICTMHPTEDAGACGEDLGGPLTMDDKLVGIITSYTGCSDGVDLITRVSKFIPWINSATA
jgi:secreted trypsin-like serine protease